MVEFPSKISLELKNPCYRGSVQNLYEVPGYPWLLVSETTVGGSVFDVGTIFTIEGADVARASFRHHVFLELGKPQAWINLACVLSERGVIHEENNMKVLNNILTHFGDNGASTHHVGMIDRESGTVFTSEFPPNPSNLTMIRKYEVLKPTMETCLNWHFYDYKKYYDKDGYIIPLEYIVRFGVTSGSSILRKYDTLSDANKKDYMHELGVHEKLSPWLQFSHPIIDFTTKYEPEDRNISCQEAVLISGVQASEFSRSIIMVLLGSYLVQQIFSRMGLFLWDLKWEVAKDGETFVFADTIDTDSVRATVNFIQDNRLYFVHFNKQAIRDYYKLMHSPWYNGVNAAKKIAANTGRVFTDVLREGQERKEFPPTPNIDKRFLGIQEQKFRLIQSFIQNRNRSLDFHEESKKIAQQEVEYYLGSDQRIAYETLNSIQVNK